MNSPAADRDRHVTEQEPETITSVFPVEIHDQCGDCWARADAPPKEHHVACSINWN
ncbi:hypothetical protein HD597_006839 [Nonomuraea thailandensis]|uniref:Uncharacterized protein n=1 Tax=Nonomuraea thailandensis TaxID=1188745 RepID=A0A9X2GIN0_9ACTN|nr:hypothetical protein [Nonomuraea thailandensis]MCP2359819.1 hypothetical protein [Nonomuraea thailandensis]